MNLPGDVFQGHVTRAVARMSSENGNKIHRACSRRGHSNAPRRRSARLKDYVNALGQSEHTNDMTALEVAIPGDRLEEEKNRKRVMRLACTRENNIEVAILDLNPLRRCFVVVSRDALDLPGILEGLCTPAKIEMSEFSAAGSLTRNNPANVIAKLSDWQHLLLSRPTSTGIGMRACEDILRKSLHMNIFISGRKAKHVQPLRKRFEIGFNNVYLQTVGERISAPTVEQFLFAPSPVSCYQLSQCAYLSRMGHLCNHTIVKQGRIKPIACAHHFNTILRVLEPDDNVIILLSIARSRVSVWI
ncbi:hypothetical protein ARMGADRAFT_1040413 [Armillaria gallica]|uniref:Uncharacterized protein n=1 Tax=Armillaria gallica TaxID=47427 RepID=A0A2H3CF29_ARMGA|nr:hypothetical protein ARMGADRAFT_1040413 [Armillaria gallica]